MRILRIRILIQLVINHYLNNILKAAMPLDAPNYNNTPNNDSRNAPTEINKTTNPIYTQ